MKLFYVCILIAITVFSYGFIDPNFPYQPFPEYFRYVHSQRTVATAVYISLLLSFFVCYRFILSRSNLTQVWWYIWITVGILFFAYPAFSSDIFNYITTAKVTYFYRENPYIVMPNEIPNEPMVGFLHASNKVALYGWSWIALTFFPHTLGMGNIILTMIAMKILIIAFYIWLVRLIERVSDNPAWSVAFFALNPLVIMETLVVVHQDVVMMALALYSFILLRKRRFFLSLFFLILSIFIKGATVFLVPVYFLVLFRIRKRVPLDWERVWYWCALSMIGIFALSPFREEMYPWYFIWVLTFVSLLPKQSFFVIVAMFSSLGLEFRIVPYLYTWRWDGVTPMVKRIVTLAPPALAALWYGFRKKV